jgi:hypothetical protein
MIDLEKLVKKTVNNKYVKKAAIGTGLLATSYFIPDLARVITDNIDSLPTFIPAYSHNTLAGLSTGLVAGSVGRKSGKETFSVKNICLKSAKFGGLFAAAYYSPALIPLDTIFDHVPSFIDAGSLVYSGAGLLAGLIGAAWKVPRSKQLQKTKSYFSEKWRNVKDNTSKKVKKVAAVGAVSLSLGNMLYHLSPIDIKPNFSGYQAKQYLPFSRNARDLFKSAAKAEGLPESWGDSKSLHNILRKESNGYVGIPNYCIKTNSGRKAKGIPSSWPKIHDELKNNTLPTRRKSCGGGRNSTASGLGQLLIANVDKFYPNGRDGIGDAMSEARGMLRYIKSRYGHPDKAWAKYGKNHEGY